MPKRQTAPAAWGGPRPGAGRPKLPPEARAVPPARARITFDLAPDEAALVDAKAAAQNMTRSAYIRALVLADIGVRPPTVKGRRPRRAAAPAPPVQSEG